MGEGTGSDKRRYVDPVSGPAALTQSRVDDFVQQIKSPDQPDTFQKGEVSPKAKTAVVIVAGGSGERFGNPGGKQLFEIMGKPVLTWSAKAFDATPDVGLIVIVCSEQRKEEYDRCAIEPFSFATPVVFAPAGDIRQQSAMSGIDMVPGEYERIIVHDGARPLVTVDLIEHALSMLRGNLDADGVVVGHPSVDTLKVVNGNAIATTPDRSMFWTAQTPQVFRAPAIRGAYRNAMYDGFVGTDDSSLVERVGGKVLMFNGPRDNIKVTVPEDVGPVAAALAARLAKEEEWSMRIGLGYDVHAFAAGRKLILGGVEIPYEFGLDGHSDADVLVHAIMDAIVGGMREGDIGKLFPDTDPAYKGADSIRLLEEVGVLARARGFEIEDIDSVVMLQEPKMSPYREQMRCNIAEALQIPVDSVGVKATTTEHLGYEGRGEGASAQAVVLLSLVR